MSIQQPLEKGQFESKKSLIPSCNEAPQGRSCSSSLENIEIKHPQNKNSEVEVADTEQLPEDLRETRILQQGTEGEKRLKRIIKHRKRSRAVVEYAEENGLRGDVSDKIKKLKDCGSYLRFRHWYQVNKTRVVGANFCKNYILCTFCAALRASKYVEKLMLVLQEIGKSEFECGRPVHCVLSIKNTADIEKAIEQVIEGRKYLLKRRRDARKGSRHKSALKAVEGGVWVIEIKKGSGSGLWHVHCHCLFFTTELIDQNLLQEEWRRGTNSRKVAIPWLKYIGFEEKDLLKAVLELFKYTVKPGSCTPGELIEAHKAVFGKYRLIQSFGCLRGVQINEDDLGESGREGWGAFIDYFLSCGDMNNNYRITRIQKSEDIEADIKQGFEVDAEMASWWDEGENF